jgi:4-amino-4-deoxy-L-arabinose transferase-like glycosyltransferase
VVSNVGTEALGLFRAHAFNIGRCAPHAAIVALACATIGVNLGPARLLSYHEALVAQGAREMIAQDGNWMVPTIGGMPWLEKPPLAHWLVAAIGAFAGRIDETAARLPSAAAALFLAAFIMALATRHHGRAIGTLAAAVCLTTFWLIQRGRLADADIQLTAILAGTFWAFDGMRSDPARQKAWRVAFFALLGAASLAKGIGFGAALASVSIAALLLWDRDVASIRALAWPVGWLIAIVISLAWPLAVLARFPEAIDLWNQHLIRRIADRSVAFASEPLGPFLLSPLIGLLPWTPIAMIGFARAVGRARRLRFGIDRLLICWFVVPIAMLSCAAVRNDHYLIHALPPCSIWAALGLARWAHRITDRTLIDPRRLRVIAVGGFAALGLVVAIIHLTWEPAADSRGREWAWYRSAARSVEPTEPFVLLYDFNSADPWDRKPYETPFGQSPHDLAVRLFYLDRPATWLATPESLQAMLECQSSIALVARERDLPALRESAKVEPIAQGPADRWDRTFSLVRLKAPDKSNVEAHAAERALAREPATQKRPHSLADAKR